MRHKQKLVLTLFCCTFFYIFSNAQPPLKLEIISNKSLAKDKEVILRQLFESDHFYLLMENSQLGKIELPSPFSYESRRSLSFEFKTENNRHYNIKWRFPEGIMTDTRSKIILERGDKMIEEVNFFDGSWHSEDFEIENCPLKGTIVAIYQLPNNGKEVFVRSKPLKCIIYLPMDKSKRKELTKTIGHNPILKK